MELTKKSIRLVQAAIFGAGVSAYYATPDFIRCRTGRFFAKSAFLASIAVANATIDYKFSTEETSHDCTCDSKCCDSEVQDSDIKNHESESESTSFDANEVAKLLPESTTGKVALFAGLTGMLVASTALEIAIERAIFRRGERRRAQGVALAHSRFGLGLGLASGLFYYLTSDTERDIVSEQV